jgi:hypothetical protein
VTRHVDDERLSAWISGDLSERDTAVVRAHVESCADCAESVVALRAQVVATRSLHHPEPPPTLWPAIEGALESRRRRLWSWRSSLVGALAGAVGVAVAVWAIGSATQNRQAHQVEPGSNSASDRSFIDDPLLAEAERELEHAATAYADAVSRLRKILEHEQVLWDPETRARVSERVARLDEAVAHSRAVARRDPSDSSGADMLFSAYRRQIDFLAEAVHRGSPAAGEGLR